MSSFDSGNDPGDNFDFDEDLEDFFYDDEDGDANEMVSDDLKGLEDFDDKYEVLSAEALAQTMEKTIEGVRQLIQLPHTQVRLLLNQFKWDKEKMLEEYYSDNLCNSFESVITKSGLNCDVTQCEICYLECTISDRTGLDCGHWYCKSCWTEYLTSKIMTEGSSQSIACPTILCNTLVEDQMIYKLVSNPDVRLKYQILISNSFVEYNRLIKWCTSPGCNKVIKANNSLAKLVICDCGNQFCFSCVAHWHEPIDCNLLKKWLKKCQDDSETSNWLAANTKDCPKCQTTIEKNGGCNHITCKKESCKNQFCWICLADWKIHGTEYYTCSRYVEVKDEQANTSRAALSKYLFYYERFIQHQNSLNFEKDLQATLQEKIKSMMAIGVAWLEAQFLHRAQEMLCQSRRTLMYTYVLAFYLKRNNQTEILEENQKDVEVATERLSSLLEVELRADNVLELKQSILDEHNYVQVRRKVLLDHVAEANEKDLWNLN